MKVKIILHNGFKAIYRQVTDVEWREDFLCLQGRKRAVHFLRWAVERMDVSEDDSMQLEREAAA